VHYYDPHAKYAPPSPFAERFRERPYLGEIAYVDSQLGRLLEGLRASGRLEDALVVVTADHGESLGEHMELTHSYTLYDATLAVPLLLRGPGVPAKRVVGGVVRTVDIAPTVLSLLGVAGLADADGQDLAPRWAEGADPPSSAAYAESLATQLHHGWSPLFAMRTPQHHYVRAPRPELYDVGSDPGQVHDLAADGDGVASTIAQLDAEVTRVLETERQRSADPIDPDTRQQLAALGYTIPAEPVTPSGLDPKDGMIWLGRYFDAIQAVDANRLRLAQGLLEEMLAAVPTSAIGHSLLARVYILQGRSELALEHAEAALRLLPGTVAQLSLLGDAKVHVGDHEGADAAYRAAAAQDPEDPLAQAGLVWAEARAKRWESAQAHARRAFDLDPSGVEIRHRIGTVWERVGEYERALEVYQDALRLDSECEETHMFLAIQFARLGQREQAEEHLKRAALVAETPHYRNRLAIVYAALGKVDRAEAMFRALIRDHPEYRTSRQNLATLMRQTGRAAGDPAAPGETPPTP
jgi:tetratricopeptide (TPR) repeat protein